MRLFLLRHGLAEPGHAGLRDFERPLTAEGRARLADVGRAMQRLKIFPNMVLTSPLIRARQTAEAVAPALDAPVEVVDELRSGATYEDFERLIRRFAGVECLMIVGHEPDFSGVAAALIGAASGALVLKKAGLIRVDTGARVERGRGRLRWLLTSHQLELIGSPACAGSDDSSDEDADER